MILLTASLAVLDLFESLERILVGDFQADSEQVQTLFHGEYLRSTDELDRVSLDR